MKNFPKADIYEQFFNFTPWGMLINKVCSFIYTKAPANAKILDLMCGPGYLLGEIHKQRSDLILEGVDLNQDYISYAITKYPLISFQVADALIFNPVTRYDIIICTGGLHHLTFDNKTSLLEKISCSLSVNGFAIFADPYFVNYSNEIERKEAAASLGYEYIISTIKKGATDEVVEAIIDILYNDVMAFEYKTSLQKIIPIFEKYFNIIEIKKVWPEMESEYGDYYLICNHRFTI